MREPAALAENPMNNFGESGEGGVPKIIRSARESTAHDGYNDPGPSADGPSEAESIGDATRSDLGPSLFRNTGVR